MILLKVGLNYLPDIYKDLTLELDPLLPSGTFRPSLKPTEETQIYLHPLKLTSTLLLPRHTWNPSVPDTPDIIY